MTNSPENLVSPLPRLTPLGRVITRPAEAATHNPEKPILYKEAARRRLARGCNTKPMLVLEPL